MSTDPRDLIAAQLDATLREHIIASEEYRIARRASDAAQRVAANIESTAVRLRMALYALDGSKASMGDANAANHERSIALRSEVTR